jgi:hypothetical protein
VAEALDYLVGMMTKRKKMHNSSMWIFLNQFLGKSGIYNETLKSLRQELAWRMGNNLERCIQKSLKGLE